MKQRPAVVLYEGMGNVVIAGVTSNNEMQGIPLTKEEGAIKDSVIKLNYIFTVSEAMIIKKLFVLCAAKKKMVYEGLDKKLKGLESI